MTCNPLVRMDRAHWLLKGQETLLICLFGGSGLCRTFFQPDRAAALLAALPVAVENIGVDVRVGKPAVVEFAHAYADLLTKKFIEKRDTYPGIMNNS
jgi:hypothetical protein